MKDIDFLPDWYTSGKRRQIACRTQYVALAGILAVMVVWNVVVGRSVTKAEARVEQMTARHARVEDVSKEFDEMRGQIRQLQKQAGTIDSVDSRVDVAGVLGELSCLIDESVVLKKVDLIAEKFANAGKASNRAVPGSIVRAVRIPGNTSTNVLTGDVRFKILIGGIAADGGDVMSLVSKLEDSEYFFHVELSYSRNSRIRTGAGGGNRPGEARMSGQVERDRSGDTMDVSEFEISCYLANYLEP